MMDEFPIVTHLHEHALNDSEYSELAAEVHIAAEAADLITELAEVLRVYGDTLCEFGPSNSGCGKYADDVCFGCRAKAALAKVTEAPDGDRL